MTETNVLKIAKQDIKKNGSYVIPKDHPRCELTRKQAKNFKEEMKTAMKLVKKGVLEIEQDDRELRSFQIKGS